MATLVRCIEGHAFDMSVSETCPSCGSTVWKKQTAVESKSPRNFLEMKKFAVAVVSVVIFLGLTFAIANDIWAWTSKLTQSAPHLFASNTNEDIRNALSKEIRAKLDAFGKVDSAGKNAALSPGAGNENSKPSVHPPTGSTFPSPFTSKDLRSAPVPK